MNALINKATHDIVSQVILQLAKQSKESSVAIYLMDYDSTMKEAIYDIVEKAVLEATSDPERKNEPLKVYIDISTAECEDLIHDKQTIYRWTYQTTNNKPINLVIYNADYTDPDDVEEPKN
jgi:hypothetical protein